MPVCSFSQEAPRVVNVTSDSQPGWIPTEEQQKAVEQTIQRYQQLEDNHQVEAAFAELADAQQKHFTKAGYEDFLIKYVSTGKIIGHKTLAITWTKDPKGGPFLGTFAAVDIVSKYEDVDRECGYLVVYAAPNENVFKIMHEEINRMTNANAKAIVEQKSQVEVDKAWKELSARCPNYKNE